MSLRSKTRRGSALWGIDQAPVESGVMCLRNKVTMFQTLQSHPLYKVSETPDN
jgi:hypothetical protein